MLWIRAPARLSRCINEINDKNDDEKDGVITSLFTRLLLYGYAIFSSAAATV
jgi:hypothetical protein